MKTLRLILLAAVAVCLLTGFGSCEQKIFQSTPGGVTVLSQDAVLFEGQYVPLSMFTEDQQKSFRLARLVIPAGSKVETQSDQLQVRPEIQQTLGVVQNLPIPYASEVGWGLSALLGTATMFLNAKRKRAVRGRQAVVAGNDVFLDAVQQTPIGPLMEDLLIKSQVETQKRAKVQADIDQDLLTVRTPDKPTHTEVTPELVAALKKAGALK